MDLSSPSTIKTLLREHNLRPNKIMGQHFLVSQRVLQQIVEAAALIKEDTVLEVGPGLGVLTKELAQRAGHVVAVEKDRFLIPILQKVLSPHHNIEIIHGDILRFEHATNKRSSEKMLFPERSETKSKGFPWKLAWPSTGSGTDHDYFSRTYKLVADIPYYLTSRLIRVFLESPHQPSLMVLLVQKEVAQRICATPPHATLLSNAVQYYAKPKIVSIVPKSAFYPIPKVDSAVLKLTLMRKYDSKIDKLYFSLLKKTFSKPRKQILHILSGYYPRENVIKWLKKGNIEPKCRPGEVEIEKWQSLAEQTI